MENDKVYARLVMGYNPPRDYETGVYNGKNGYVVVISNDQIQKWKHDHYPIWSVDEIDGLLRETPPFVSIANIGKVYLSTHRDPRNALRLADELVREHKKSLELLGCKCCHYNEVAKFARELWVPVIRIGEGHEGEMNALGKLVDKLLVEKQ